MVSASPQGGWQIEYGGPIFCAMPRINLIPTPIEDTEPELDLQLSPADSTGTFAPCAGCLGKGRYVGFLTVEDPCRFCGGSGLSDVIALSDGLHPPSHSR